ncbi:MAG: DNA ligase D [Methylocystis sp.]|uniref:DNA ligase D n=1 Tax=Methylocystis sp. TaxID=1911079 RepID=UPI003D0F5A5E
MSLADYRKKRDFSATREPQGRGARKTCSSFVIQKHAARRLHYDLRLEMDGVLKSWAVTRGPSLVPGEKRLAVHVEDHPLDYRNFEGVIPKGQYGAGEVIVWDKGVWIPEGDPHKAYAKGHLDFELRGEKLRGRWHLVRMARKPREKHDNWLLIKSDDAFARSPEDEDILEESPQSVKTGRTIGDVVADPAPPSPNKGARPKRAAASRSVKTSAPTEPPARDIDPSRVKGARKARLPNFVAPMQARPGAAPTSKAWVHEIKFDGYRVQARIEAGRVRLLSRSGLDWTKKFGDEIVAALRALPLGAALIDGEIVVETGSGASDFSALQADLSAGRTDRFVYWAFDLLYLDGYDLRAATLLERKDVLEQLVSDVGDKIRLSGHFEDSGAVVLSHACRLGLEGVVSKLRDSPYRSGRVKSWIKAKCFARQEFVIGGYTPSTVSRRAIGALALGVYQNGVLRHVGRVGTGFTDEMAHDLFNRLDPMRIASSPFGARLSAEAARHLRYVRPELVAEVEFRGWTADHVLRHASFRGLREDKDARDVVREKAPRAERTAAARAEGSTVKLTHPDRLYWPDQGVTKQGLADYYAEIWRHIAPFIVDRPLALLRCPNGVEGEKFFQKHAWKGIDPSIFLIDDPRETEEESLLSIRDLDGLIALVQSAALEIHPWGSTASDWERPDVIVMDLDPGEQVAWESVIAAAQETRDRLQEFGLAAFVKTSGGKGLHVMAPLTPKAEWPQVKAFTKSVADAMAKDSPGKFVATIAKSKRHGKILVDYLRNQRGATAVAPYSTRARPGAAVSVPLAWDELSPAIGPDYFTIVKTLARLDSLKSDPWADFRQAGAPIETPKPRRTKKA